MKYFDISEFDCSHTGKNEMNPEFLERLDELRRVCSFPFIITSGYRHETHPIEEKKKKPGTHTRGIAADIAIFDGNKRRIIVQEAINLGFNGIGIAKSFVHVDIRDAFPVIWTY